MRKIGLFLVAACASMAALAAPPHNVAGSTFAANSPYATDAYPGFDGLDETKRPEKKDKSWFNWVDRDTPSEQYSLAQSLEAEGKLRKARRACDALVQQWPAASEAPLAQLRMAKIYAQQEDYDSAVRKVKLLAGLQYTLPQCKCSILNCHHLRCQCPSLYARPERQCFRH